MGLLPRLAGICMASMCLGKFSTDINALSTGFCWPNKIFKAEDYVKRRVTFYFGGKWKTGDDLKTQSLGCICGRLDEPFSPAVYVLLVFHKSQTQW
ncbi:hypothetical protein HOY80DRAFT_591841 [Tuber brumale]|nr:hypothetical protein HOY80DRAFT_591841 [Tuber brumale]